MCSVVAKDGLSYDREAMLATDNDCFAFALQGWAVLGAFLPMSARVRAGSSVSTINHLSWL